jgi:hypothetical protein
MYESCSLDVCNMHICIVIGYYRLKVPEHWNFIISRAWKFMALDAAHLNTFQ